METQVICPIIHGNGDTEETLMRNLQAAFIAVEKAGDALRMCRPHGRNYYPVDGLLEKAVAQHQERDRKLVEVGESLMLEMRAITTRLSA